MRWFQQQHSKIRVKRDYSVDPKFPYTLTDHDNPSIIPIATSKLHTRETGAHSIFPDPLFKEQWYLVSVKVQKSWLFN